MEIVPNTKTRRSKAVNAGSGPPPDENSKIVDEESDGQKRLEGMEKMTTKSLEPSQPWEAVALFEEGSWAGRSVGQVLARLL